MKIWIDIDGVLANFEKNINGVVNSIWPGRLTAGYVPKDWHYADVLAKNEWDDVWSAVKKIPDFWFNSPTIEENVSTLRTWIETAAHEIFYITSRMPTGGVDSKAQTQLWLHKHGLYDGRQVVIAVDHASDKKEIIERYEIDLGIDDFTPTVQSLSSLSEHKCYILSQPWNADATGLDRVSSMKEFLEIVDSVSHWSGRR